MRLEEGIQALKDHQKHIELASNHFLTYKEEISSKLETEVEATLCDHYALEQDKEEKRKLLKEIKARLVSFNSEICKKRQEIEKFNQTFTELSHLRYLHDYLSDKSGSNGKDFSQEMTENTERKTCSPQNPEKQKSESEIRFSSSVNVHDFIDFILEKFHGIQASNKDLDLRVWEMNENVILLTFGQATRCVSTSSNNRKKNCTVSSSSKQRLTRLSL